MNEPLPKVHHCPYCRARIRIRSDGKVRKHFVVGEGKCPQSLRRLGDAAVPSKQA